ncbi:hypothetical protein Ancab_002206 [Ancistrocladus abbreviatus]
MMRGPTSGLSSGSPIPVLLSAKHAWLRGSGGIRAVSTGVIAPISHPSRFVPDPPPALRCKCTFSASEVLRRTKEGKGEKNEVRSLNFANPSEGNMQVKLGEKEGISGRNRGSKPPRRLGTARKSRAMGTKKKIVGCNTRTSQEVTHPSTTLAQTPLKLRSSDGIRCISAARAKSSSGGRRIMMRGPTSALSSGSPIPGATLGQTRLAAGFWWDPGRQYRCDRAHFPSFPLRSRPSSRVEISSEKQLRGTQDYDEGSDKCAFVRVTHPGATLGQTRLAAGFWWDPGRQYRCDRAHFPSFPLRSRPSSPR